MGWIKKLIMTCKQLIIVVLLLSVLLFTLPVSAEESITVATWNVGFIDRSIAALNLDDFLSEVDFDILLVNEIKTQRDLDALKTEMGRSDFFTAISSFTNGNNDLEVGIISRFPLENIVEFDRSPDNQTNLIREIRLERVNQRGIADVGVGRGFLVAEVPALKLYVIVTHLKSSRGASGPRDFNNAQKRELVAAAIAKHVQELRQQNPDYTVLVGGDVNVGVSDQTKNGTSLIDDQRDGYDETHALLGGGLIDGLAMRSLAKDVGGTFVGTDNVPDFPGTGAIDVLYVIGPKAAQFGSATAASDRFGSDHLAVFASTGETPVSDTGVVEIVNAMPNPVGPDPGRETVTLTNNGEDVIDISGWLLQDRAENTYVFPTRTQLNPGQTELVLTTNTMPLNNSGDTLILKDRQRTQRGPIFSYSANDVVVGQPVR